MFVEHITPHGAFNVTTLPQKLLRLYPLESDIHVVVCLTVKTDFKRGILQVET